MAEHTYARDETILAEQLGSFSDLQRLNVRSGQMEAIGYVRGRMDASQDHGLPWCGIDPLDFAAAYARHLADAITATRTGHGSTHTLDIRSAWESYLLDSRITRIREVRVAQ